MTISEEINAVWQDMIAEANLPPLEEDDMTVTRFQAASGLSTNGARDYLDRKVKARLLRTVEKRNATGNAVKVYVPVVVK